MEEVTFGFPTLRVTEEGDYNVVRVFISNMMMRDFEIEVKEDFVRVRVERDLDHESNNASGREWDSNLFSGELPLPSKVLPIIANRIYSDESLEFHLKKK